MNKPNYSPVQLKRYLTEQVLRSSGLITLPFEQQLESMLWEHWFNPVSRTNLRLRLAGLDALKTTLGLQSWQAKFQTPFDLSNQHLVDLDRFMTAPFFINRRFVWCFGERDYVQIMLYGNDLEYLLRVLRNDRKSN